MGQGNGHHTYQYNYQQHPTQTHLPEKERLAKHFIGSALHGLEVNDTVLAETTEVFKNDISQNERRAYISLGDLVGKDVSGLIAKMLVDVMFRQIYKEKKAANDERLKVLDAELGERMLKAWMDNNDDR